jgi:glutamyl-tRNA reductase
MGAYPALAAAEFRRRGFAGITVANRTPDAAERLARRVAVDGTRTRAVPLDAVPAELATADLVIACTGARDRC